MAKGGKYAPLTAFLRENKGEIVAMTFQELGKVVPIPDCALGDRSAWANCTTKNATPFQRSWLAADYRVRAVDLKGKTVTFSRGEAILREASVVAPLDPAPRREMPTTVEELILLTKPPRLSELEEDEHFMVALSRRNAALTEVCIAKDPAYAFKGKKVMEERFSAGDFSEEAYAAIIKVIANENSTRTPDKAIPHFARFCTAPEYRFTERLQAGDVTLPDDITAYLKGKGVRSEKSLASKVCRFLNEWQFGKCDYTINDSVVRGVLPYYLAYYGIEGALWRKKKFESLSYAAFYRLFALVREKSEGLNNHELDHLIWYAYKNDPVRAVLAKVFADIL